MLSKATFAMGCFWKPDALFGCQKGIHQVRVGYTGGKTLNPTYEKINDHTEAVDISYDSNEISYSNLLKIFWANHDPTILRKTQYQSAIFYHDEEQKGLAEETKKVQEKKLGNKITTRIEPFSIFYNAENYHQKYYLQTFHPVLFRSLGIKSEELITSKVAAKLNGYISGEGSESAFDEECHLLQLSKENIEYVKKQIKKGKSIHCH